jgi:hypothetical protein
MLYMDLSFLNTVRAQIGLIRWCNFDDNVLVLLASCLSSSFIVAFVSVGHVLRIIKEVRTNRQQGSQCSHRCKEQGTPGSIVVRLDSIYQKAEEPAKHDVVLAARTIRRG